MKKLHQFIKILGDANRLSIIHDIGYASRSVSEIIDATGLSQTLVSFHLRALRDAEVVTTRRDGPFIYYSLTDLKLIEILVDLAQLAGREKDFSGEKLISISKKSKEANRR